MRVYTNKVLAKKNKRELRSILDSVKSSCELTTLEKTINIDKINSYLKKSTRNDEVLLEIGAGRADDLNICNINGDFK